MLKAVSKAVAATMSRVGGGLLLVVLLLEASVWAQGEEPINPFGSKRGSQEKAEDSPPAALNPFGQVKRDRDDAVPGYVEMSDGRILAGDIYMTRDKRLKFYDPKLERQREIPLQKIKQIECQVVKEWMEKEWKFKELALDEKYYTGREYPSRECEYTITLQDDRQITGPLAELFYIQPYSQAPGEARAYRPEVKPERFLVYKRDKGEPGTTLEALVYVKSIKLGEEALEEGKKKAKTYRPSRTSQTKPEK